MSEIGKLRQAAAQARTAFDAALVDVDTATASRTYYEFAVEQWKLSHTGEDREPLPIIQGNARYDVAMRPPPTDEQVTALEKAAAKAERKLNKARQALTDSVAAGVPKREPTLSDYRNQLEEIKKDRQHQQEVAKADTRPKDTNMPSNTPATDALIVSIKKDQARARGEEVADDLDETIKKKLESWAGRVQIRNEIKGKYGSLSTPRVDQRIKIKALWWASPDGKAVKELLREQGAGDPELILKSHSEASAAIVRLDA